MDFKRFSVLTFDCYGTLIDWESGILAALQPLLARHSVSLDDEALLELYAELESLAQSGRYKPYRQVCARVVTLLGQRLSFEPAETECASLAESIKDWPAFPDTVAALRWLKQHFRLAILSNIDDDLFVCSGRRLEVPFDFVITAEQLKGYKPRRANFTQALVRIGERADTILHVAQSLFHDIVPATELGLATVWVNRRVGRAGFGATRPARATADLELPDLKTLVQRMQQSGIG